MKYPKRTFAIIFFILLGFSILYIGIEKMFGKTVQDLQSDVEEAKKSIRVYNIGDPLVFDVTPEYEYVNVAPTKSIILTIEKDIIFVRDTIKIKAEAKNVSDDVLEIALIINDGTESLSNKTRDQINFEREYARDHNLLLELNNQSSPPFVDEIFPKFNLPDKTYHVTGAVLLKNGTIHSVIKNSDELFTIYSKIHKLQVDTNKAILEQIDNTEINNLQQEITNQYFLGLAIIGIAVIPIVTGFDFLFRLHVD